jgi:ABC-2 type transport system ATP-binding protein
MAPIPVVVDRVTKRFDKTLALDEVSLEIRQGEIFGLLGPNGAGKTTLIRTILDIIRPDSGRVEIFGRAFQSSDRDRIGYLPEERGLYARERVSSVLEYLAGLKGLTAAAARTAANRWLGRFEMADVAGMKIEQLSKGNQQKLQIAASLVAGPAVAVLDEPLSGLDPVSARLANTVIADYAAAGHTVVLSTHQMGLVEALCSRVFMIARGRSVLYGALRDIKREYSSHAVRVRSSAAYDACPFVTRVENGGTSEQPANVHLSPAAHPEEFLAWLVAHGARVEYFEQLSTPLEEIFVTVAERAARVS